MNCTSSNQIVHKGRVSLFVFFFVVVSFCFVFFRRMVANKWRRNKEITIFTMLNALKDLTGWSHHTKRHNWTLCLLSVGHHTTYEVFLPKKKIKIERKSDPASRSNFTSQEIQGMGNMTKPTWDPTGKLFRANNSFPQQINSKLNF